MPTSDVPPETILFVEDEALIRMDLAEFLRECGYRVHEAVNATEAIQALESKFAIDLVFTDINMPGGMNGVELAEWVRRERPGVKVLITTGGSCATVPEYLGVILRKPYTGRDLLERIRESLARLS